MKRKGKARHFPYVTANLCLQGTWLKTDMDLIALPSWGITANVVALLLFAFFLFHPHPRPPPLLLPLTHFFKPALAEATVWAVNPLPERQLNSIIRRANNLTELIVHYISSQMADGERIMFEISCRNDRNRAHAGYDQELLLMNTTTLPQSETVEPEVINMPKDFFFFFLPNNQLPLL